MVPGPFIPEHEEHREAIRKTCAKAKSWICSNVNRSVPAQVFWPFRRDHSYFPLVFCECDWKLVVYPFVSSACKQFRLEVRLSKILTACSRQTNWATDKTGCGLIRIQTNRVIPSSFPEFGFYHMSDFICGSEPDIFSSHLTEPIVLSTKRTSHRIGIGRTSRRKSSELAQWCAQSHNDHLNWKLVSACDVIEGEYVRGDCCSSGRADTFQN